MVIMMVLAVRIDENTGMEECLVFYYYIREYQTHADNDKELKHEKFGWNLKLKTGVLDSYELEIDNE